jgi:protein gp37
VAQATSIEWTDTTWNPVTGCTKVSPGCKHCYAERMANRLRAMAQQRYANGFRVTLQKDLVSQPLSWRKPRRIFVNSMSDLFHPAVPLDFIQKIFHAMEAASWHQFQILTKRAERVRALSAALPWPPNVWLGVSVESEDYLSRIGHLTVVPAAVRFLSLEPLLGPLSSLRLDGIHWVIVGGESGPGARPMDPDWVREIRSRCLEDNVAFFFKQWGGTRKSRTGRELDGRTWDQLPLAPQTLVQTATDTC